MKERLQQWAAKVDAMSVRERAMLFVSVLVCLVALADWVWISPAQNRYKLVQQKFSTQSAEVVRLRTELQAAGQPVDQNQLVRADQAQAEQDLQAVQADIQHQLSLAGSGRALEPVLVQFLRRQGNLTLLGTTTLEADAITAGAGAAAVTGLTRQGLELRVAGSYPELVRYVAAVEAALPQLRWGRLQIKAEKQPPELAMQVYVLGVKP